MFWISSHVQLKPGRETFLEALTSVEKTVEVTHVLQVKCDNQAVLIIKQAVIVFYDRSPEHRSFPRVSLELE